MNPQDSDFSPPPKQHALHIPEIASLIVAWLTSKDILFCRGVSKEWRRIFSPFLQLHAIYWNHGQAYKAQFEDRLETLGPFVEALKLVYPIKKDLDLISRTCTELRHVGFFTRSKHMLNTRALFRFLENMSSLEEVTVYSFERSLVATVMHCLATYRPSSSDRSLSSSSTSTSASTTATAPQGRLRKLAFSHATHSLRFSTMEWKQLEAVLENHPRLQSLSIQECHLLDELVGTWDSSIPVWPTTQFHNALNGAVDIISTSWKGLGFGLSTFNASREQLVSPMMFDHIESIDLQNVQLTEELLFAILDRCPALQSLEFRPTGCDISAEVWSRWLPRCGQLKSVKLVGDGGVGMNVLEFWMLAPCTLHTFYVSNFNNQAVHFTSAHIQQSSEQLSPSVNLSDVRNTPGSRLISLHLDISLKIGSMALHYIMTACRSLKDLVLGIQYFTGWENPAPSEISGTGSFPPWACAHSLRRLELKATYQRQDQKLDMRLHAFMRRLEDLTELEHLLLPMKLLNDLSESRHEEYAAFRGALDRLDSLQRAREREERIRFSSMSASAMVLQDETAVFNSSNEQHRHVLPQAHVWVRDKNAPRNFIPQLPAVREVTLKSEGSSRLVMKLWYLHIIMEAMSGLKVIWTSPDLYGIDIMYNFKQLNSLFQRCYDDAGVQLNVGYVREWES
ncbi:hypothetical protein BGX28_001177 [Mortierella sp. GBA30]|nr:hypothetical protein BGX28_001177 [Mortierella sp. GBA30]